MFVCPQCGPVDPSWKYCAYCGSAVMPVSTENRVSAILQFGLQIRRIYSALATRAPGRKVTLGAVVAALLSLLAWAYQAGWISLPPRLLQWLSIGQRGAPASGAAATTSKPKSTTAPTAAKATPTETKAAPTETKATPTETKAAPTETKAAPAPQPAVVGQLIARGRINSGFDALANLSPDGLALVQASDEGTEISLLHLQDGNLVAFQSASAPVGQLMSLSAGDLYNDGQHLAIAVGDEGALLLHPDGMTSTLEVSGARKGLIGDWDGEGDQKVAFIFPTSSGFEITFCRFAADGTATSADDPLSVPDFPGAAFAVFSPEYKRDIIIGTESRTDEMSQPIGFYALDAHDGLKRLGGYRIADATGEPLTDLAALDIGGRLVLVGAYQAAGSYLELYDMAAREPTALGRIALPDGQRYILATGSWTSPQAHEILAMAPSGSWAIYDVELPPPPAKGS